MHLHEFERYVQQHQDRVYGFACSLLRSADDARDVTQDVLVRLWRRTDALEEDSVLPWLMRVTRNACIDVLRRRQMLNELTDNASDIDALPHDDKTPAEHLQQQDDRRIIEAALEKLSEPYRSIVVLREIQNLKYEEISAAMDMPMNTVKVYLHRGRKMLREQLTEVMESERI